MLCTFSKCRGVNKKIRDYCLLTVHALAPFRVSVGVCVIIRGCSKLAVIVLGRSIYELEAPYSLACDVTRNVVIIDNSTRCRTVVLTDKLIQLIIEESVLMLGITVEGKVSLQLLPH